MTGSLRYVIRNAVETLKVAPIEAPAHFLSFYEANLAAQSRQIAYGIAVMGALVRAFVDRGAGSLLGAYDRGGRLADDRSCLGPSDDVLPLVGARARLAQRNDQPVALDGDPGGAHRHLTVDFDGFSNVTTFNFLNGFCGTLKQWLGVGRMGLVNSVARRLKRTLEAKAHAAFAPNL
jgi:hypothetical protein